MGVYFPLYNNAVNYIAVIFQEVTWYDSVAT